jgi:polyribonucleotide nucleotidyltransferase
LRGGGGGALQFELPALWYELKDFLNFRLARFLPPNYLYDLMAISDRHANLILKKLEQSVPDQGVWGAQGFKSENEETSSQVRIPSKMVSRLIGERGKTITEICRDSKTKITIPRVHDDEPNVVLTIIGTKVNIKTAQYLMQKLLKGQNK